MRIVSFLVALFISITLQAQINNWSKGAVKTGGSHTTSISVDKNADIYFTGTFFETLQSEDFYFDAPPNSYKTIWGKYKSDGTLIRASAFEDLHASLITCDQDENFYIAGTYHGDVTFNGITYALSEGGFLAKYNNQGNPQWIRFVKGEIYSGFESIKVDSENNVYVYGNFSGQVFIGDTAVDGLSELRSTAVLAKYDPSGNFLWARSYVPTAGDFKYSSSESIQLDEKDNVYVTGGLVGTLTVDSTTIAGKSVTIFIHKLDKNGNSKWLTNLGAGHISFYRDLSAIHDGAFYYVHEFDDDSTNINGEVYLGDQTRTTLIKCDTSGIVQWSKLLALSIRDVGYILSFDVETDHAGNIIVAGSFSGEINFIDTTFSNHGDLDPFILKFDRDGNLIESWSEGYESDEVIFSIAFDSCGNYYLAGMYQDSTAIGGIFLKNTSERLSYFITRIATNNECDLILGVGNQISDISDVMIFPNPAYNNESAQISIGEAMSGTINISLKDVMGNKVHEQTAFYNNDLHLKIATNNLVSGTYFVEISDEKKIQVKKLVVVK